MARRLICLWDPDSPTRSQAQLVSHSESHRRTRWNKMRFLPWPLRAYLLLAQLLIRTLTSPSALDLTHCTKLDP